MNAWVPSATCKQIFHPLLYCGHGSYNPHLDGSQLLLCPVLETLGVGTVRRHHGVQGGAAGAETLLLGLVPEVIQLRDIITCLYSTYFPSMRPINSDMQFL